jgi:glycosyltransferase involved in cell wall biosynthesis
VASGFLRALSIDPALVLASPSGHVPVWWSGPVRRAPVPPGRPGRPLWEQLVLPILAGRRRVLSLANTAPLTARHAVLVHDLAFLAHPEWYRPSFRLAYGAATVRAALSSPRVLVPSSFTAGELVSRLGVEPARITVVRPGIDDGFTPPADGEIERVRSVYRLPPVFLVAVGSIDPRKGLDVAARVAARVGLDLVVIGAPARSFEGGAVPPGTRHLGRVPDGDLPGIYAAARALLYPSRYEGFGLPPLEAMACGTPVVASDIPALRETLTAGAALVPPDAEDAWVEAATAVVGGGAAAELREAGLARAAELRWPRAGIELHHVLAVWPEQP